MPNVATTRKTKVSPKEESHEVTKTQQNSNSCMFEAVLNLFGAPSDPQVSSPSHLTNYKLASDTKRW